MDFTRLSAVALDADLVLEPLRRRHTLDMYVLVERNRGFLRPWLPWLDETASAQDMDTFVSAAEAVQRENDGIYYGIWYRHVLAGVVGLGSVNEFNRKADIGYWLGEAFQGRGLVTRGCHHLVQLGFAILKLHRLQILCAPDNARSRQVAERLGFRQDGVLRDAEWLYDHFVDSVVYSVLASDWVSAPTTPLAVHTTVTPGS